MIAGTGPAAGLLAADRWAVARGWPKRRKILMGRLVGTAAGGCRVVGVWIIPVKRESMGSTGNRDR